MFYYNRYLVPPLRTKFLAKWEFRFWVFDSIAVLLFVNMKVDTGEIPINIKKESIKKRIQLTNLILIGTLSTWMYPQRFFRHNPRNRIWPYCLLSSYFQERLLYFYAYYSAFFQFQFTFGEKSWSWLYVNLSGSLHHQGKIIKGSFQGEYANHQSLGQSGQFCKFLKQKHKHSCQRAI